jgi:RHS repeat-associated protein
VPVAVATVVGVAGPPAGAAVADHPAGPPRPVAVHPGGPAKARVPAPTRTSRTVRRADGRYTTTIYPHSVNYRTAGGWRRIDSSLVPAGGAVLAWRNKANRFTAAFARHAGNGYLRVQVAGQTFDFDAKGAAGAAGPAAAVAKSRLAYAAAYRGADLVYDVGADAVNETVVLHNASAPASYEFAIRPRGRGPVTARRLPGGSWGVFRGPVAGPVFVLAAPRATQAQAGRVLVPGGPPHAAMTVRNHGTWLDVRVSIDRKWLASPGRVFPVRLDPTIIIGPDTQDGSFAFSAGCGGCTPYVADRLYAGTDSAYAWRPALQFDLSAIPAGAAVTSAQLGLYYDGYCLYVCGNAHALEVHRMTAPWSAATTSSQVQFDPAALSTVNFAAHQPLGWLYWPVTATVQSWLTGAQPNDGLLVKQATEPLGNGGVAVPGSGFSASAAVQPQLQVTYTGDGVTLLPPTTLHSNGAELTWARYTGPSGAPFQQYAVYRSATPHFTPSAASLLTTITDPAVTSYTDTTAAPGRAFSYAVVANSDKSNEVTVTLPADGQATKTLQPGPPAAQDTFTHYYSPSVNCANYGADPLIYVGSDTTGVLRGLLRFSLNDIPAAATITKATLSLWQQNGMPAAATLEAHRVTRGWAPGSGTNSNPRCTTGATWYDAGTGVPWSSAGGDFDAAAASVAKPASQSPSWDSLDVTGMAQQWVSGAAPNLGVLLKLASEPQTAGHYVAYPSGDFTANPGLRPQLTLTYTDGSHAQPPQVSLAGPAPGATVSGASVTLAAGASDDGQVDHVDFLADGTVIGTDTTAPYTLAWDSTAINYGTRTITARAVDDAGNATTSSPVSVTVNNLPAPSASVTAPAPGSTVSGHSVTLTASAAATAPATVAKVDFYADGQLIGTATASPYTLRWDTLDPANPAYDGAHALTAKVTDSTGQVSTSAPVTVTAANTAGTPYQAGLAVAAGDSIPDTVTYDPAAGSQQKFGVHITVTNTGSTTLSGSGVTLAYRWVSPDSPAVVTTGPATPLGTDVKPGKSVTLTMLVPPPPLPDGVNSAGYQLMFDLYDSASTSWFAAKGNPPVTAQVQVLRKSPVGLGLEKYYQYDAHPVGAGLDSLVNVASGNLALNMTPWQLPGRGLASVLRLTYNGLEDHSRSPAGNNWSLAISSLTRFGAPLDIHPSKADQIAGVSDKLIGVTDGDGTLHVFTGTTNPDGTTTWAPPPGFNLYLRPVTTDTTAARYWALSRPDHVTFYYNYAGWPTAVVDKNGNTLTFTETATPPGEGGPGGAAYRITRVTDPGGQDITLSYYTKAQTQNAHQRGRVADITDHAGHVLHFDYYTDGNLLRITQRGGTTADGSFLPDRSWVFTYLNSQGSGPAIPPGPDGLEPASPDPKTPNEDSQIYSVRDPDGHQSSYTYYLHADGPDLAGRVKTVTDRAGHTTSYGYDTAGALTTVTDPLGHPTSYAYDGTGRVVAVTDPLTRVTTEDWTAGNQIKTITEDNGAARSYSYNANGYLTDVIDQDGNHTKLTYTDRPLDGTDTGAHWSLLATKTAPQGVATGSGYEWQFFYDGAGNLTTATDPAGHTASYCYNLAVAPACNPANDPAAPGTLQAATDFNGNTTTFNNYNAGGQPQQVTDPLGRITGFGFDADGNLVWTQDPVHHADTGTDTTSYRAYTYYDSFNRPGRTSQPKSTSLDRGQLIWTDTSYDANNNITATQDAHYGQHDGGNGATTTTRYDAMDRPVLTTRPDTQADAAGQRTQATYDAAGRLTTVITAKGVQSGIADDHTTSYGYDAASQLTSQTQYQVNGAGTVTGTRTSYSCYDNVGNVVTVTAPNATLAAAPACPATTTPNTTSYTYDDAHQRLSVTDPDGHQQSVIYDHDGQVTQATDASGNITTSSYDQNDRLIKVVAPYVPGGRTTTTEYAYDNNGNKIRDISPRAYDASADKTTFTDYVTAYAYDAANEMTRQTTPSDAATPPAYIHHYYDGDGRQTAVSLPVTQPDPAQVSAAAKTVSTLFDTGWIASSKDPATPAVHFDYTAQGWQATRIPERPSGGLDTSLQQSWVYYPDGKTASYTDQGGQSSAYHYDADNNLTYATEAHGLTTPGQAPVEIYADYTGYDELAATHYRPTSAATYTATAYQYDHDGNVTERDDNATQTRTSQTTNPAGVPVSWNFTQTSGGAPDVNTLSYDTADWLQTQDDNGTTSACNGRQRIATTWTPTGQEATRTIKGADANCAYTTKQKTTWDWFDNGKLHTDTITNGAGAVLETHTVGYETGNGIYLDGNRTSDAFALNGPGATTCTGATPSCTATYSYDAQDRLKSYTDGHGGTTSYTFDQNNTADPTIRAGNITTQTGSHGTTTSTYNGTQLTSTTTSGTTLDYYYDGYGRQTCVTTTAGTAASCNTITTGGTVDPAVVTASSYDFMDRFTATSSYTAGTKTGDAAYTYDALNRTAQQTEHHPQANITRTTTFNYQGLTNLATQEAQQNTGATTSTDTKTYNYDSYGHRISLNDTTVSNNTTTTGKFTYGYDVHGSVSLLVDQSNGSVKASYGYTPYGAPDTTLSKGDTNLDTPFNPFRYTGKRYDSGSKTLDMGTRRFDPTTQRFLQADQYQGALNDLALSTDPLTANRYALAASNPLSAIEYDGHNVMFDGSGGGTPTPTPPPPPYTGSANAAEHEQVLANGGQEPTAADIRHTRDTDNREKREEPWAQGQPPSECGFSPNWKCPEPGPPPDPNNMPACERVRVSGCHEMTGKDWRDWGLFMAGVVTVGAGAVLLPEAGAGVVVEEGTEAASEGAEEVAAACGGMSFTRGTKVLLASGKAVPIASLRPGEKVLATNTKTGKAQAEPVTAVLVHHDTNRYNVAVKTGHHTAVIHTTSNHLFWDQDTGRWVRAGALTYGTRLRTPGGTATVTDGYQPRRHGGWMWDLTIRQVHDFYVQAANTAILAHNCAGVGSFLRSNATAVAKNAPKVAGAGVFGSAGSVVCTNIDWSTWAEVGCLVAVNAVGGYLGSWASGASMVPRLSQSVGGGLVGAATGPTYLATLCGLKAVGVPLKPGALTQLKGLC